MRNGKPFDQSVERFSYFVLGVRFSIEATRERQKYVYHLETYEEHITGLLTAYKREILVPEVGEENRKTGRQKGIMARPLHDELTYVAGRLAGYASISAETFERVLRTVIATYDLGKLDETWQAWVRKWRVKSLHQALSCRGN